MKILIVYATAGAGHKKAAEALANALRSAHHHEVVLLDALEYTSAVYRQSYSRSYTFLVSRLPWAWGFFFMLSDIPWLRPVMTLLRRIHNTLHARRLADYLRQQQFDYIFSTHFLPNEVSAWLKRRGQIRSTIVCCVTDYDVHRIWLSHGIDDYCVASDWTRDKICSLGAGPDQVRVTGIPTDEKFSRERDTGEVRRRLGLDTELFTVLIATGSFGIGPIEQIVDRLDGIQVLAVCGHNRLLYEALSRKQRPALKVYGFVDNMDELMAASNAMITKPGGLSISESLVVGLPMVFFNAIPGQEENNVRVLARYGVGISGRPVDEIADVLKALRDDPQAYAEAAARSKALGRPQAVHDILAVVQSS